MTTQYDVKTAKIQGVGTLISGRCRLKQATIIGSGTAGYMDFFDSTTAPTAATYDFIIALHHIETYESQTYEFRF